MEAQRGLVPGMPLRREQLVLAEQAVLEEQLVSEDLGQRRQGQGNKKKKRSASIVERAEPRQVRVAHGKDARGRLKIWLYVPEKTRDKSGTKRKGWWLYPEPGKPRRYYIGPLEAIQSTVKKVIIKDVAVFENFPFTRSVEVNCEGVENPSSVRCVTDRPMTVAELKLAKDDDEDAVEVTPDSDSESRDVIVDDVEESEDDVEESEYEPPQTDENLEGDVAPQVEEQRGKRNSTDVVGVVGVRRSKRHQLDRVGA